MKRNVLCGVGMALAGFVGRPTEAQAPIGPELRVNSWTTSSQTRPSVARDAAGRFVVVWDSYAALNQSPDGSKSAVVGQRFDASGNKLGGEFVVNAYTSEHQSRPDVVATPDGGFAVVWQGFGAQGNGIYARRFSESGAGSPEFQVSSNPGVGDAAITASPVGELVVVWRGGSDILVRRIASTGAAIGAEFGVGGNSALRPDVAWLPKGPTSGCGAFVVVWGKEQPPFTTYRRTYDPCASPTPGWLPIATLGQDGKFPSVGADAEGRFVVAWSENGGAPVSVQARGFTPAGTQQFAATLTTAANQASVGLSVQPNGDFVASWQDASADVSGSSFAWGGAPRSGVFRANTYTTGAQIDPVVSAGFGQTLLITWNSDGQDGDAQGIFAQPYGDILGVGLTVDPPPGNQVLDPGETVSVAPVWRNLSSTSPILGFSGTATSFTGPPGFSYSLTDSSAVYPTISPGASGSCSDCYGVMVTDSRPTTHVDATLNETIGAAAGGRPWTLHVGGSFTDVPATHNYYKAVETALHRGLGGCGSNTYCPSGNTTREQVAVFLLKGKEGAGYVPPACVAGSEAFSDVPSTNSFCPYIEELARRLGTLSGCGTSGAYCPSAPVSRKLVAEWFLRVLDPTLIPPDCAPPYLFNDVTGGPSCKWIQAAVNSPYAIISGCDNHNNFCPTAALHRDLAADVMVKTFGLTLYGP